MRTSRASYLLSLASFAAIGALSLGCGGGGAAASTEGAKTPGGATTETTTAGGAGAAADPVTPGGPTTTTTSLPEGGELQGAKLGSATHTEVETRGEGGPKVSPGHQQEPGRKREDIQTIVMARRDEARACYDKGLKDHPGIEGDLDIKWTIDPQGNVTKAEVDSSRSTIHEPSVGSCIVEVIKKIKFAPSKGGYETHAHYPFNFHPRNSSAKPK